MPIAELTIRNLVLVEEAILEFSPNLNIITGETGAGKSLLINGLNLIVGERADPEKIGKFDKKAEVSAVFHLENKHILWLREMGFDVDDSTLIIRRVIRKSGSKSYVNGVPVTQSQLRKITRKLLDIHGQHTHQMLLDESTHIDFLDKFGGLVSEAQKVAQLFKEWKSAEAELNEERRRIEELKKMRDFLEYQYKELASAELKEGEDEDLERRIAVLSNIERLKEGLLASLSILYEDENSAHSLVSRSKNILDELARFDPKIEEIADKLDELETELSDIGTSLASIMESLVYDPNELNELNARLAMLNRLKSKYHKDIKGLIDLKNELKEKLQSLELGDIKIKELEQKVALAEKKFMDAAEELSQKRRAAADKFEKRVEKELSELGMGDAKFTVEFQRAEPSEKGIDQVRFSMLKPSEHGIDRIRFMIATIPGQEPRPLTKIVSGGELSRIMLALKVVLAEVDEVETLVFDEIDVGIGGRIAEAVGRKMHQVAKTRQVIAVTHLPQIAAFADRHFKVERSTLDGVTKAQIEQLDEQKRVLELARMIAGDRISETSIKQAEELIMSSRYRDVTSRGG